MAFKKATRSAVKLKIALTGPSGSGKTWSALEIAKGLGGKIALIDTENHSASSYSHHFDFDTDSISSPYTVERYSKSLDDAVRQGYNTVIIDSISHAWAGEGGLLDKKEKLDGTGRGNSYTNWATITKEHEVFKAHILNSNINIIATMRSKQDYSQEKDDKGKTTIRKVGLAPVQRDGIEYEFTTVFDLDMNHNASVSKDRTGLFDGQIFRPSSATGELFKKWIEGAEKNEPSKVNETGLGNSTNNNEGTVTNITSSATFSAYKAATGSQTGKTYQQILDGDTRDLSYTKNLIALTAKYEKEDKIVDSWIPQYLAYVKERGVPL